MRASLQRAARLGRQPVDASARGEEKDAQEGRVLKVVMTA